MQSRAKNIIILFLLAIIAFLLWVLYDLSYGRYCRPIIREPQYPGKIIARDTNFEWE